METEYSSYRLGLTEKRAGWLVAWLRAGNVAAKERAQGLGRLSLDGRGLSWGRYMPGLPHHAEGPLPWAFSKSSPNKLIAALELLATLIAVKLWAPDSEDRQVSRVALRGFTDNQSNEALVKKAMTTKYPCSLVLLELAEELAAKKCDLSLTWIRRDLNQLADDLTNEKFDSFDPEFRVTAS